MSRRALEVGDRSRTAGRPRPARRSGRARRARPRHALRRRDDRPCRAPAAPCRARAAATASNTSRVALRRLADLARVEPDVELRQMEAEQLDAPLERRQSRRSAMRAPRFASRLSPDHAEVGEQVRRPSRSRRSPSRHHMNASFRRYASPASAGPGRPRARRSSTLVARDRLLELRRDTATSERLDASRDPELAHVGAVAGERRSRGPARARGRIVSPPTSGLPSMSPPIQLPNENGSGSARRAAGGTRGAAARPRRTGSPRRTRGRAGSRRRRVGRSPRTSSVCQRIVISSASWRPRAPAARRR